MTNAMWPIRTGAPSTRTFSVHIPPFRLSNGPPGPSDMRDHCSLWRIRRHDFGLWYRTSPLSAGAPLDSFWPVPVTDRLKQAAHPVSQIASSDVVERLAPGREPLGPAIQAADCHLFPTGPPKGMLVSERRRRIRAHLKKHGIADVSDKTFQRHGIKR